jgi:O-antigen/teichoic acid export membrane protein
LTKAGTRAAVNVSPEPFTNWALSFSEDIFVVGLTWFAVQHPVLATAVAIVLLAIILAAGSFILRAVRRRFARSARPT